MTEHKPNAIRTVVVDNSPTARELLLAILQDEMDIEVIGTGDDGEEAINLTTRLHPDVVIMGVRLSHVDGLTAMRRIMSEMPTPIIIVTSDQNLVIEGVEASALRVMRKPSLAEPESFGQIIEVVRVLAKTPCASPRDTTETLATDIAAREIQVIGITAAVGGSAALLEILQPLSGDFALPILVVQHVAAGLDAELAQWLDNKTALKVALAESDTALRAGTVLLAPHDYHLQVNAAQMIQLTQDSPYKGLRPAANRLFFSLAQTYGARAAGIVLSGISDDGAAGLEMLHMCGGVTIAQEEHSCVADEMPCAAIRREIVDYIFTPPQIANTLQEWG